MGKSPGKWIKTFLLGKKPRRSFPSKGRDVTVSVNKEDCRKGPPAVAESSPVFSEPVLVSSNANRTNPETDKMMPSSISSNGATISTRSQDSEFQGITSISGSVDSEGIREEKAAVKAQAAFRGYLARRAFRALKGIIRLQALIRGHLVRRQAVVTLRSMQAILKLQALFRSRKVRQSGIGLEISTKSCEVNPLNIVQSTESWGSWKDVNGFISKLASSPTIMPLQLQYVPGEPNSTIIWLERWSSYRFVKPVSRTKKTSDSKSPAKRSNFAMETESARSKRTIRHISARNVESGLSNAIPEAEKSKLVIKKSAPAYSDSVQEHPQSELENVKRNLRKISNLTSEPSERMDVEPEKLLQNSRKIPSIPSDVILEKSISDAVEKPRAGNSPDPELKLEDEISIKPLIVETCDIQLDLSPTYGENTSQNDGREENLPVMSAVDAKEEQISNKYQKFSKRRASFSAKPESIENGALNITTMPSYMAATESVKAKLRGQTSPRFGPDLVEKNGYRRHSLPSSTNGKVSSNSPRTQRLSEAKRGSRSDKSLLSSSRVGHEKAAQSEWRR